jgi:hypothetical protein
MGWEGFLVLVGTGLFIFADLSNQAKCTLLRSNATKKPGVARALLKLGPVTMHGL